MHSRNSTSSCLPSLTFLMRNTETPAVKRETGTRFFYRHSGLIIFRGEAQLTAVPLHARSACKELDCAGGRRKCRSALLLAS